MGKYLTITKRLNREYKQNKEWTFCPITENFGDGIPTDEYVVLYLNKQSCPGFYHINTSNPEIMKTIVWFVKESMGIEEKDIYAILKLGEQGKKINLKEIYD
jgi:hypothetical protein